jgi:predicted phage terminase large subunit-like protein
VGFSTESYRQRRASFERNNDIASWNAQYMGEPIEREGTLFSPSDFRYYNGELPEDRAPDRIFLAVDPSFGGGDFVSGPICYKYGNDIYVHDVVYNNCNKKITQPLIVGKVEKHGIQAMQIEATKATASYAEEIDKMLKDKGIRINLTTKPAPPSTTKFQRINDKAPDIREMMIFRESGKRSKEYEQFMQNVFSYKIIGKNKNDDAPDSLSMAIDMVVRPRMTMKSFDRPF